MSYSLNPNLPRTRMEAVRKVWSGWSIRKTARYFGVHPSTVLRWRKRAPTAGWSRHIPTQSSRPFHHPKALASKIVSAIIAKRKEHNRCAKIVHHELGREGVVVSLASVKRVLKRHKLLRYQSRYGKWRPQPRRPEAAKPGDLVQIDTIHMVPKEGKRWYVYTLIDLFSRWAHATVSLTISAKRSRQFVASAQARAPFRFAMLQSDHGSEFSKRFRISSTIRARYSRLRRPNDNAHIERFNRTVQEECFSKVPDTPQAYQKALGRYLVYYNTKRLHLGINCQTPLEVLRRL